MPDKATNSKNRVLVKNTHIARVGGSCDLAAFQLTPPLGRSIAPVDGLFTTRKKNEFNQCRNERCTDDWSLKLGP
jgi:hypothetical protein